MFGVLREVSAKAHYDPVQAAYQLGLRKISDNLEYVIDPAKVIETYKDDPAYAGERDAEGVPLSLRKAISDTQAMQAQIPGPDYYAKVFEPEIRRPGNVGVRPTIPGPELRSVTARENPFEYFPAVSHQGRPWHGSTEEQAVAIGQYISPFSGKLIPLEENWDKHGRRFEVVDGRVMGPGGDMFNTKVLKELPRTEPVYGKQVISRYGPQTDEDNPLVALGKGFWTGSTQFLASGLVAMADESMEDRARMIASALQAMDLYNNTPTKDKGLSQAALAEMVGRGNWASNRLMGLYPVGSKSAQVDEFMKKIPEIYAANPEKIKKDAANGDMFARGVLQFMEATSEIKEKSRWQRFRETFSREMKLNDWRPSERAEQGWSESLEGFSSLVGNTSGFLATQMLIGYGVGAGVTAFGGTGLVSRGIVGSQLGNTLTRAGARTTYGITSAFPGLAMGQQMYDAAREVGYSDEQARNMGIAAIPMVMLTETVMGVPWMNKALAAAGKRDDFRKLIVKSLLKDGEAVANARKGSKIMESAAMKWIMKGGDWLDKGSKKPLANAIMKGVQHTGMESSQESLEEFGYEGIEWLGDLLTGENKFEGSRPLGYSSVGRLWDTFVATAASVAPMGAIHGYHLRKVHRDSPHDRGLARVVAEGKGQKIMDKAAAMQKEGAITSEDLDAVSQTVKFTEGVIQDLKISNPEVFSEILDMPEIVGQYAISAAEIRNAEARIAEAEGKLGGPSDEAIQAKINEDKALIEQHKEVLKNVESGKVYSNLMRERALFVGEAERRDGKLPLTLNAEGKVVPVDFSSTVKVIDEISDVFRKYKAEYAAMREEQREKYRKSSQVVNDITKELEELTDLRSPKLLGVMNRIIDTLGDEDTMMGKEQGKRLFDAISAQLNNLYQDPGQLRNLVVNSGADAEAQVNLGQLYDESGLSEHLDFDEWFDQTYSDVDKLLGDDADESVAGIVSLIKNGRELKKGADELLGRMDTEEQILGPIDEHEVRYKFLDSIFQDTGQPASLIIEKAKQTTSPTRSQLEDLAKARRGIQEALALLELYDSNMTDASGQIDKYPEGHPVRDRDGIKALVSDLREVYKPFREDKDALVKRLTEQMSEMTKEATRLEAEMDRLNEQVETIWRKEVRIRGSIALKFIDGVDPSVKIPQELQAVRAKYEAELAKEDKASDITLQMHVEAMEAQISKLAQQDLEENKGANLIAFGRSLFADRESPHANGARSYGETIPIDTADYADDFHEDLVDNSLTRNQFGVKLRMVATWLSRMARVDYAEMVTLYDSLIGSQMVPQNEQRTEIFNVASFLVNSNDELTEGLMGLAMRDGMKFSMPNRVKRAYSVQGMPGVGKSTMIVKQALRLYRAMTGVRSKVAVMAPGLENATNLVKDIGTVDLDITRYTTGDIERLKKDKPDVIILDEAQTFDPASSDKIQELMDELGEGTTIIFLGDPLQAPGLVDPRFTFPLRVRSFHGVPLQAVFRHENTEVVEVGSMFRDISKIERVNPGAAPRPKLNTKFTKNGDGVRLVANAKEVVAAFIDHMNNPDAGVSKSAILIVKDDAARDKVVNDPAFPDAHKDKVRTMSSGINSALSTTRDMAFVMLEPSDFPEYPMRFLYTAITRAKRGVVMSWKGGTSVEVDNVPQVQSKDGPARIWADASKQSAMTKRAVAPYLDKDSPAGQAQGDQQQGQQGGNQQGDQQDQQGSQQGGQQEGKGKKAKKKTKKKKAAKKKGPEDPNPLPPETEPVDLTPRHTRVSRLSAETTGGIVVGTVGMLYDPSYPGTDKANSLDNPAFVERKKLFEVLGKRMGAGEEFTVRLIKQSSGSYNSTTGEYVGPAFEVKLNNIADTGLSVGDFLGLVYINTFAKNVDYADQVKEMGRLLESGEWKDGESMPGYDNIPLNAFHPGIRRDTRTNKKSPKINWVPYQDLLDNIKRQGQVTDPPFMHVNSKDPSKPNGVILRVRPWPGGPYTEVVLRTTEASDMGRYREAYKSLAADKDLNSDKIRQSVLYKFFKWNQAVIDPNDPTIKDIVHFKDGVASLVYEETPQGTLKNLAAMMNHIIDQSRRYQRISHPMLLVANPTSSTKEYIINDSEVGQIEAATDLVQLPQISLRGKFRPQGPEGTNQGTSGGTARNNARKPNRRSSTKDSIDGVVNRQGEKEARNVISRLLGDKFVNGSLEFTPDLSRIYSKELYGVMDNGRIILETDENGTVREGVARHEALHYVVDFLLDERSKEALYADVKQRMLKGSSRSPDSITETDVHEYMAQRFERKVYDTTTLTGRFFAWLHGVLSRWGLVRSQMADLFYRMENGDFVDAPALSDVDAVRYSEVAPNEDQERTMSEISDPYRLGERTGKVDLAKLFATPEIANSQSLMMVNGINRLSAFGSIKATDVSEPRKLLSHQEAAAAVYRNIADSLAKNPMVAILDGKKVPFGELTQDQLLDISDHDWDNYCNWRMSDPKVFSALVEGRIPGTAKAIADAEKEDGKDVTDQRDPDMGEGNANIHNSNDLTNWMSKSSTLANLILDTTYRIDENGVERTDESPVDVRLMLSVVRTIMQEAFAKADPSEDVFSVIESGVLAWLSNPDNKGSLESDLVTTFVRKFISASGRYKSDAGDEFLGYANLALNGDVHLSKQTSERGRQLLTERINAAHQVLAHVVMPMLSTVGINRWIVNHFQSPNQDIYENLPRPGFKHTSVGFSATRSIQNEMNEGLLAGYNGWNNKIGIDPDFRGKWEVGLKSDTGAAMFKITNKGIRTADNRALIRRKATKKEYQWFFELEEGVDAFTVKQFFIAAGHNVSARTVEFMLSKPELREFLADVISHWAYAIHSSIHAISSEDGKRDPELFSNQAIGFWRNDGIAPESADTILKNSNRTDGPAMTLVLPSSFHVINRRFAAIEMRTRGAAYEQRVINPDGGVVHPVAMATPFSDNFPGRVEETSTGFKARALSGQLTARDKALLDLDGKPINPFLDNESNFYPDNVEMSNGAVSNTFNGNTSTKDMTTADLVLIPFDRFLREMYADPKVLQVPGSGYADRNEYPVFKMYNNFGGDPLVGLYSKKDTVDVVFRKELLVPLVQRMFKSHLARIRESKNAWMEQIRQWGLGDEKTTFEDVKAILELVTPEMVERSVLLAKNLDWKMVDGKVAFGNRIDLASEKIYTQDAVREYVRLANAGKNGQKVDWNAFIDQVYGQHMQAFRDQVGKWSPRFPKYKGAELNPKAMSEVMDAFFMMQHLVSFFADDVVLGEPGQFTSVLDASKRSVLAFSPGQRPWIGKHGIEETTKVAMFKETKDDRFDGQSYTSPFHHARLRKAYGGDGGLIANAPNKRVAVGRNVQIKSSEVHISRDMYIADPLLANFVQRSLLIQMKDGTVDTTLRDLWNRELGENPTQEQYWRAVDMVQQAADAMGVKLIDVIPSSSNVKSAQRGMNYIEETDLPFVSTEVLSRDFRVQLKLERSLSDGDRDLAYFGQVSFLMGLTTSGSEHFNKLQELEGQMAYMFMDEVEKQVQLSAGSTRKEKVASFLRNMTRGNTRRIEELMSQAGHFLENEAVDLNNPVVARKVVEVFSTILSNNALLPKMPGQHMTQVSSGAMRNPSTGKDLKPPGFVNGKYQPGEVMVSSKLFSKYELPADMHTIEEAIEFIKDKAEKDGWSEKKTKDWLEAFDKDLTVFVVRTPSSSVGSGQFMRVVGFVNDVGNAIFTPPGLNKYTGGDYDGDQLGVYLRSDKAGRKKRDLHAVQAQIMDVLWDFYNDPANKELVGMQVSAKRLDEILAEIGDMESLASSLPGHTVLQTMAAKRQASAGGNLVGIGASMMRSYSVMFRSYFSMSEQERARVFPSLDIAYRDSEGSLVLENINVVLNGMLDNTKHGHMGRLGVTEDNVSLFFGALVSGKTIKEAVLMLRSEEAMRVVEKLEAQSTLTLSDKGDRAKNFLNSIFGNGFITDNDLSQAVASGEFLGRMVEFFNAPTKGVDYRIGEQHRKKIRMEYNAGASIQELIDAAPGSTIDEEFPIAENRFGKTAEGHYRRYIANKVNAPAVITKQESHMAYLAAINSAQSLLGEVLTVASPQYHRILVEHALKQGRVSVYEDDVARIGKTYESMVTAIHMHREWNGKKVKLLYGFAPMDLSTKGGQYRFLTEFPTLFIDLYNKVLSLPDSDPRKIALEDSKFMQELRLGGMHRKYIELRDGRSLINNPDRLNDIRLGLANIDEVFTPDLMPRGFSFEGGFRRMFETYAILKDGFSLSRNSLARILPSGEEVLRRSETESIVDSIVRGEDVLSLPTGEYRWMTEEASEESNLGINNHKKRFTNTSPDGPTILSDLVLEEALLPEGDNNLFDLSGSKAIRWSLSTEAYHNLYRGKSAVVDLRVEGLHVEKGMLLELPTGDSVKTISVTREGFIEVEPASPGEVRAAKENPDASGVDRFVVKESAQLSKDKNGNTIMDTAYTRSGDLMGMIASSGVDPRNREVVTRLAALLGRDLSIPPEDGGPILIQTGKHRSAAGVAYAISVGDVVVSTSAKGRSARYAEFTATRAMFLDALIRLAEEGGVESMPFRNGVLDNMIAEVDTLAGMSRREVVTNMLTDKQMLAGLRRRDVQGENAYKLFMASLHDLFNGKVSAEYIATLFNGPAEGRALRGHVAVSSDLVNKGSYGENNAGFVGSTVVESLKAISENSRTPFFQSLAKALTPLIEKYSPNSKVGSIAEDGPLGQITKDSNIAYRTGMGNKQTEATLLHEAVHRATLGVLTADPSALNTREKAYREAMDILYDTYGKRSLELGYKHPGLENTAEFVATAMSDMEFVKDLRMRKTWTKLVDGIMKWLGLEGRRNDFDQMVSLTMSYIEESSKAGRDLWANAEWGNKEAYNRRSAEALNAHVQSVPITGTISLMDNLMTGVGDQMSWSQKSDDRKVDWIIRNYINPNDPSGMVEVKGVRISLAGMTESDLRREVKDRLLQHFDDNIDKRKGTMASVLNEISYTGNEEADPVTSLSQALDISKDTASLIMDKVNHRPGAVYLKYSELANSDVPIGVADKPALTAKDLNIPFSDEFVGFDPLVQVYVDGAGKTNVNLIDMVNNIHNVKTGKYLLGNYINGPLVGMTKNLQVQGDVVGAKQMSLALTAMAIKHASPDIKFGNLVVFSMKDGELSHRNAWMPDMMHEVRHIKETPALFNSLPEGMKDVLSNESLYDGTEYDQSFMQQYIDMAGSLVDKDGEQGVERSMLLLRDSLLANQDKLRPRELLHALYARQKTLRSGRTEDSLASDKEYILLNQIIMEVHQANTVGRNIARDTSSIGAVLKNAHDMDHDLVQLLIRTTERSVMKINERNKEFRGRLNAELEKLMGKRVLSGLTLADTSWRVFERLWRWTDAVDESGVAVKVWDNSIHWDKNDPETAKLLKEGKLTQAELDFANFVLDELEKIHLAALIHKNKKADNLTPMNWEESEEAMKKAKKELEGRWRRGWLPSVTRQASEALGDLKLKTAANSFFQGFERIDNIFGDDMQGVTDSEDNILNAYLGELEKLGPLDRYGGRNRLSRIGLDFRSGQLVLSNPKVNASRSRNIEDILSYARLATDRQIIHENETLPLAHAVKSAIRAEAEVTSIDQKFHIRYIGDYLDKVVYNRDMMRARDKFSPFSLNVNKTMNAMVSTISFTGVALNWKVALASGVMNTFQAMGFAVASNFAKDGYFGMKEWTNAIRVSMTPSGNKLLNAMAERYYIDDWQEKDLARSFRHSKTSKVAMGGHFLNYANWWTDHQARMVVMAAQMLKEGSFYAHSLGKDGEIHYDEKKDRRFYKEDGTFTEDGEALRNNMRDQLEADGTMKDPDGKLPRAYDMRSTRNFKYIADKYVVGAMDAPNQAMLNGVWYGKMMTTFKNFMITRIHNWSGRPGESDLGGSYKVHRTADGRELVGWEKRRTSSYLYSMAALIRGVVEAKGMGLKAYGNLKPEEKRMLAKMSFDVLVFIAAYAAYALLTAPPDDPEKDDDGFADTEKEANEGKMPEWRKRLYQIIQQLAEDGYIGSPLQLINTYGGTNYGPVPLIAYAYRLTQLPTNPKLALRLLPGYTTGSDTWEVLSTTFGENKK